MKKLIASAIVAAAVALPAAPAAAEADDPARAGVSKCTANGTTGVYVWYYDLQGGYHATRCLYTGP